MIKDYPTFVQFRDAVSEFVSNDGYVRSSIANAEDSNLVLQLWMLQFNELDHEDAEAISKTIRDSLEADNEDVDHHKLRLALGTVGCIAHMTADESPISLEITVLSHELINEGIEKL